PCATPSVASTMPQRRWPPCPGARDRGGLRSLDGFVLAEFPALRQEEGGDSVKSRIVGPRSGAVGIARAEQEVGGFQRANGARPLVAGGRAQSGIPSLATLR